MECGITRRVSVQQKSSSYVSLYGTPDRWQKRKTDSPETRTNLIQLKYALLLKNQRNFLHGVGISEMAKSYIFILHLRVILV